MLLVLAACTSGTLLDAGDPLEAEAYDPGSDAFYSDLADAGYDHVPGQYNIVMERAEDGAAVFGRLRAPELVREIPELAVMTVSMDYDDAVRASEQPGVLVVEPDWLVFANAKPSTACASSSSQTTPTAVAAMGSAASGATGAGVAVAILDTGISTHSDLSIDAVVSMIGSSGADDNGHGTHVAGTVAALNNSVGVVGVAPGADLYGYKVLDRRGSGSHSGIAAGINQAVTDGRDVINMSLGGSSSSTTLHDAVTAAYSAGVIQVVAAGNSGTNASAEYPAAYDGEVITVSAYNVSTSSWPSWTNYGSVVDVAAHGVDVCSTSRSGSYAKMSGTSMATPAVAGAVAVYLQSNPGASFAAVEAALEASVTAIADTSTHSEDLAVLTGL